MINWCAVRDCLTFFAAASLFVLVVWWVAGWFVVDLEPEPSQARDRCDCRCYCEPCKVNLEQLQDGTFFYGG